MAVSASPTMIVNVDNYSSACVKLHCSDETKSLVWYCSLAARIIVPLQRTNKHPLPENKEINSSN